MARLLTHRYFLVTGNFSDSFIGSYDGEEALLRAGSSAIEAALPFFNLLGIRYAIQLEFGGDTRRLHFHACVRFDRPVRAASVQHTLCRIFPDRSVIHGFDHRVCRDPDGSQAYATKVSGRAAGPWISDPPPLGAASESNSVSHVDSGSSSLSRSSVARVVGRADRPNRRGLADSGRFVIDSVRSGRTTASIVDEEPSLLFRHQSIEAARLMFPVPPDRHRQFDVMYIYGPTSVGKTTYARALYDGTLFQASIRHPFIQDYTDEHVIVLDDLTPMQHLTYTEDFRAICDPCTTHMRVLFRTVSLRHHAVVMTSNYPPDVVFQMDRLPMMHSRIRHVLYLPSRNRVIYQTWHLDPSASPPLSRFQDEPMAAPAPPHPDLRP